MRRLLLFLILTACDFTADEPPLTCTELRPGGTVDASVGGSRASQVELGALMELVVVAATTSLELTSLCTDIATDLGVAQSAVDAALAAAKQDARMTAACKLATDALAKGHEPIAFTTVTCTPAPLSCGTVGCNAAAAAHAECLDPPNVALHFGPILAMRARLALMRTSADALIADVDAITDIKRACIPYAHDRVQEANTHVAEAQKAIDALVAAAGGT